MDIKKPQNQGLERRRITDIYSLDDSAAEPMRIFAGRRELEKKSGKRVRVA
jgi:hypothetical protein